METAAAEKTSLVSAEGRIVSAVTHAMPSAEEEIWRYSRIDELSVGEFAPVGVDSTVVADQSVLKSNAVSVIMHPDLFTELNSEHATPVHISIPKSFVAGQIEIVHKFEQSGALYCPRVVIEAGENSEVSVVERFVSPQGARNLVVPVLEIRAAKAARVSYLAVNELGESTWMIAHQEAEGDRDSTLNLSVVALGGDYARVRTECRLVGQGASAQQVALYFADGNQMHDFRTTQEHVAPRTHSDLLFKGAVAGQSKSVYTGLIKIHHDARGSEAYQTNRNLTLSEGAWAESVPNLDIATNEVKCSHASTVGPIDEEQRFYLESRGIEPAIAERLVVLGFFNEVLERLSDRELAADLYGRVVAKLAASEVAGSK